MLYATFADYDVKDTRPRTHRRNGTHRLAHAYRLVSKNPRPRPPESAGRADRPDIRQNHLIRRPHLVGPSP